jgi:hypothetical protein
MAVNAENTAIMFGIKLHSLKRAERKQSTMASLPRKHQLALGAPARRPRAGVRIKIQPLHAEDNHGWTRMDTDF